VSQVLPSFRGGGHRTATVKLILTSFLTASTTLVTILGFFLQYHNLLAEFWIRLDDAEKVAISRHTVFTRGVAQLTSHIIDTFFGRKYFSLHAIAASMYLSSASFGFLFLVAAVLPHPLHAVKSMGLISLLVFIVVTLLCGMKNGRAGPVSRWRKSIAG